MMTTWTHFWHSIIKQTQCTHEYMHVIFQQLQGVKDVYQYQDTEQFWIQEVPVAGDFTGLLTVLTFVGLLSFCGLFTAFPFTGDCTDAGTLGVPLPFPPCGVPCLRLAASFGVPWREPEAAAAFGVPLTFSTAVFFGVEHSAPPSLFLLSPLWN